MTRPSGYYTVVSIADRVNDIFSSILTNANVDILGHVFCTGCLAELAALPPPHRCPTCRAEFDHDWTITLYCEIRDARVRKLRNANKVSERHDIDLTDIPSSSRSGSPSQHVDDDDSEGNGYSDTVHSHAASAALRVGSMDERTTSEQMKRAGAEVGNVVKAMGCNPQDNVLVSCQPPLTD